jgi:AcrR family transcriptional regulator
MEADKIKESIKGAAKELFRKFGYHKTSVNEIAKKAKIAKATIYKYFDSKEAVLHSLLMEYIKVSVDDLVHGNMNEIDEEAHLNNLIMKTCRLSYTVCTGVFAQPEQRTGGPAGKLVHAAWRHPQARQLCPAHPLPHQMQQKHRVQLCLYLRQRLRRAQKFRILPKRDIALPGKGRPHGVVHGS